MVNNTKLKGRTTEQNTCICQNVFSFYYVFKGDVSIFPWTLNVYYLSSLPWISRMVPWDRRGRKMCSSKTVKLLLLMSRLPTSLKKIKVIRYFILYIWISSCFSFLLVNAYLFVHEYMCTYKYLCVRACLCEWVS